MKKIIYSLLASSLLVSCYEDKGNYDYSFDKMNDISSVLFTPAAEQQIGGLTIEFTQPLTDADTLQRVIANVEQTLEDGYGNLDFTWTRSYSMNGKAVKDTVRTAGYMDVVLPKGKPMTYNVMLEVKDRTTDLSRYTQFVVSTRPIFKNSIFVLHGTPGNMKLGNVEKVGADVNVRTDAYAVVHPDDGNPFANATRLMYQATMTFTDYTHLAESDNLIAFADGQEAQVFKPFGLDHKFNNYKNYVLPSSDKGIIAVDRIGMVGDPSNQSDFYYIIGKDGRFVTARSRLSFKFPCTYDSETDYRVTAAAITNNDFVFWDDRNSRFLHVNRDDSYGMWMEDQAYYAQLYNPLKDAHVDYTTLPEGLSPVGKTGVYGYIQYRENYAAEHPFFIFKDNAGKFYLYELTPLSTDKDDKKGKDYDDKGDYDDYDDYDDKGDGGKDDSDSTPAYSITCQVLNNFAPSNVSSIVYNTWFPTNYIFYINGADIVRYNVSNGDVVTLYTAPAGYTVACMKFREDNTLVYSADLGRYLCIGLNKGDKGAVTEIKLTTGGDVDKTYEKPVYNKDKDGNEFGNISDVQFVHEYSYQLPQ